MKYFQVQLKILFGQVLVDLDFPESGENKVKVTFTSSCCSAAAARSLEDLSIQDQVNYLGLHGTVITCTLLLKVPQ